MPEEDGKTPPDKPDQTPREGAEAGVPTAGSGSGGEGETPSGGAPVPPREALSPGVQRIIQGAEQRQREGRHASLGVYHWLLEVIGRHGPMAESLAKALEVTSLQKYLYEQVRSGQLGAPLTVDDVLKRAGDRARARGKEVPSERDVAAVILLAAQYELAEGEAPTNAGASMDQQGGTSPADKSISKGSGSAGPPVASGSYRPRALRPTPTLEQYGRDLTRLAQEGKLTPVIGRQEEVELVVETLCRRTKRNPVLVGPAGVGKTAIVEGLAQRIVLGQVPEELQNVRVLALQPSTLVAGASVVGELEKRMRAILAEAGQDGIVLFIDEVHSMIGAGGAPGSSDVASLLKPALARGDLACIAATTDDEYRRYIEQDSALERRFQPVRVQELTPEQTLQVLKVLRDDLGQARKVEVPDEVLHQLIDFAGQFMRNRHFPDKAVDLLEQVVAYAITHDRRKVGEADATAVVQRMVGMPLALEDRLEAVGTVLKEKALLRDEDIELLVNRLSVTMRGLDLRLSRPNAVVLLIGEVAGIGDALSETLAAQLFGSADRVVAIDFGRFVHPADVTSLIGAPPGYVGYSDSLPLHKVAQMPWCVLRCENVDSSHPQVLEVLTQSLNDGFVSEARGKRIYLSDCVVLLTAGIEAAALRPLGFQRADEQNNPSTTPNARATIESVLGRELADQIDLVCSEAPRDGEARRRWLEKGILTDLSERYSKAGVTLLWDESLVSWLVGQQGSRADGREWERLVDEKLGPLLVRHLPEIGGPQKKVLKIQWTGDRLQVEEVDEIPEEKRQTEEKDGVRD